MTRELLTATATLPGRFWFLVAFAIAHPETGKDISEGVEGSPAVCLPFQCRGELCLGYKSAFQINKALEAGGPRLRQPSRKARKGSMIDPTSLFWMLGSIPRDN